jgi:hypothetical protein
VAITTLAHNPFAYAHDVHLCVVLSPPSPFPSITFQSLWSHPRRHLCGSRQSQRVVALTPLARSPFASAHNAQLGVGPIPSYLPPSLPFPSSLYGLILVTIFMSHDSPDVRWQLLLWHTAPSLPSTTPTSLWAPSAPHLPPSLLLPSNLDGLILVAIFVSCDSPDVWWHRLLWNAVPSLLPTIPTSRWAPSAPCLPLPFCSLPVFMASSSSPSL